MAVVIGGGLKVRGTGGMGEGREMDSFERGS